MSYYNQQQQYPPPQGQQQWPQQQQPNYPPSGQQQQYPQYPPPQQQQQHPFSPSGQPYPPQQSPYQYGSPSTQQYPQQYPPQQGQPYSPAGQPPYPPQGQNPYPQQQQQQPFSASGQQYPPQQQPSYQSGQIQSPQNNYGAPIPQPYGVSSPQQPKMQPSYPSPGYGPQQAPPTDTRPLADGLRKAMKGFGTDEAALIKIVAGMRVDQAQAIVAVYSQQHRRDLIEDIKSETGGRFCEGLVAVVSGPLYYDAASIKDAVDGPGTNEDLLNNVLLCRSNADLNAIKSAYQRRYGTSLEADIRGDLSMQTEKMFNMVLSAQRPEESVPPYPPKITQDVEDLNRATDRMGTDELLVCSILTRRSATEICAIDQAYQGRYGRPLLDLIKSEFSGHMQSALMYIVSNALDRAKHDSDLIRDAVAGMGTKDTLLIYRVVRMHWDHDRMDQCRRAYRALYNDDLIRVIRSETSGDHERLLVKLVDITA